MKAFKYTAEDIYNEVVANLSDMVLFDGCGLGTDGTEEFCREIEITDGLRTSYIEVRGKANAEVETRRAYDGFSPYEHTCRDAWVLIDKESVRLDAIDEAPTDADRELYELINDTCTADFWRVVERRVAIECKGARL